MNQTLFILLPVSCHSSTSASVAALRLRKLKGDNANLEQPFDRKTTSAC